MNLPAFIFSDPLAFHAPALLPWCQRWEMAEQHKAGGVAGAAAALQEGGSFYFNQRRPVTVNNGIAEIHVNDGLAKNLTRADKYVGMTSYEDLVAELGQAVADPAVKSILLDINSPGGSAIGAPEAAAAVLAAAEVKPVVAHIGTMGASAAYYIASGATAIFAEPSAVVGSIGTIAKVLDVSGLLASMGIKMNIITPAASDLKAAGNMFRPMTQAEGNFLQTWVETLNADFTGWVQARRPKAEKSAMRGQWFSGKQGVEAGLVDGLGTLAQARAFLL